MHCLNCFLLLFGQRLFSFFHFSFDTFVKFTCGTLRICAGFSISRAFCREHEVCLLFQFRFLTWMVQSKRSCGLVGCISLCLTFLNDFHIQHWMHSWMLNRPPRRKMPDTNKLCTTLYRNRSLWIQRFEHYIQSSSQQGFCCSLLDDWHTLIIMRRQSFAYIMLLSRYFSSPTSCRIMNS